MTPSSLPSHPNNATRPFPRFLHHARSFKKNLAFTTFCISPPSRSGRPRFLSDDCKSFVVSPRDDRTNAVKKGFSYFHPPLSRTLSMRSCVVAMPLLVAGLLVSTVVVRGVNAVDLCTPVLGFTTSEAAGPTAPFSVNNAFTVMATWVVRSGEAIVLGVKSLSSDGTATADATGHQCGSAPAVPLTLNISFVSDGVPRSYAARSDVSCAGVALAALTASVAMNTALNIRVTAPTSPDAPVPFYFFSYVANSPACYMPLEPTAAAFGAVPASEALQFAAVGSAANGPRTVDVILRSNALYTRSSVLTAGGIAGEMATNGGKFVAQLTRGGASLAASPVRVLLSRSASLTPAEEQLLSAVPPLAESDAGKVLSLDVPPATEGAAPVFIRLRYYLSDAASAGNLQGFKVASRWTENIGTAATAANSVTPTAAGDGVWTSGGGGVPQPGASPAADSTSSVASAIEAVAWFVKRVVVVAIIAAVALFLYRRYGGDGLTDAIGGEVQALGARVRSTLHRDAAGAGTAGGRGYAPVSGVYA